ncbi:MAG TPA: hypothetical protein VLW45_07880 [Pelomicrobium sp.]|nr:hypothetical protein [Pelomicrobium sp.]
MQATDMLHEDYAHLVELFSRFEDAVDDEERQEIIGGVLERLAIVEALEQEIALPAVRIATGNGQAIETGDEEYREQLRLMREVAQQQPPEERYARFTELAESVFRHIQLAEDQMLPKLEKVDSGELGDRMARRRAELEQVRLFL